MIGLLLASFVAQAAGSACVFPTKYDGHTFDGCTTKGHSKAWCYTHIGRHKWRPCTDSDNACEFPFTYAKTEYWDCTTAGHDQSWCNKVGGGWQNCGGSSPPSPPSGGFGKQSGAAGWVADHNHFRAKHGADKVTWNKDLAAKAQTHANEMNSEDAMFHSDTYNTWPASGENVAWGYGSSCSAATDDGGPKLYDGPYDQHCVMASWYGEFYLWKGAGNWQGVSGLGHFTAMVWKGVDAIGCASAGRYYVCEYGSKHCMSHSSKGGSSCWNTNPSHLPNFNRNRCSGGRCVESLFSLKDVGEALGSVPASGGMTGALAASALVVALAAGAAALIVRKVGVRAAVRLQHDGVLYMQVRQEELYVQE